MTAALINICPACDSELAGQISQHCPDRPKPCGWVRHRCGAVVDPRTGRYSGGKE